MFSGPTLRLDTRVSHAALNERYHFNKQTSLDRDGRQCMSAGVSYSYCRLRPIIRDVDQFIQVAMGMKQWDCVSFSPSLSQLFCFFGPAFFLCSRTHDRVEITMFSDHVVALNLGFGCSQKAARYFVR